VWSYWIAAQKSTKTATSTAGAMGGMMGGAMGGAMGGGMMGGGGGRGGQRGGTTSTTTTANTDIPVSPAGPGLVSGNTLLVLAEDGSLLAFDKDLGVDLTGPAVKMVWPNSGDDVSGQPPLELIFKLEDFASGINEKTIKITINDKPANFRFGRDGYAVVGFSEFSLASLQAQDKYLANKPLADGPKAIVVEVSDYLGNVTKTTYRLNIDNVLKPLSRDKTNQNGMMGGPGGPGGLGKGGGME